MFPNTNHTAVLLVDQININYKRQERNMKMLK